MRWKMSTLAMAGDNNQLTKDTLFMKVVITGAHGTVGSVLVEHCRRHGFDVVIWDRQLVAIDNYHAMEEFLTSIKPDILFHLAIASQSTGKENESWLVNYQWASELAWISRLLKIKFIYTSTAMVFSDNAIGPFTKMAIPDASSGYGYEKLMAEYRVFYQNPDAYVVRLGWQIGDKPGSNNMIDFFERNMQEHGHVEASTKWYPACSFIQDTVTVLIDITKLDAGLYMIDANEKWNFYEIATALKECFNADWQIIASDNFIYDQRMIDTDISTPSLKNRLKKLPD